MDIHHSDWQMACMDQPDRPAASPPRPLVGSVVQAVAVLRHLGSLDHPQGVTAIAARLGLSPSSCFNILKTLAAEEFATFDPDTRAYSIGPGAIDLARAALGRDKMMEVARPLMNALATRFEATIGLWRLGPEDRLTLVELAESPAATRIHMVMGQRQPAGAGATGRAVLAARNVPDEEIAMAYETLRWQRAPGRDTYVAEVRAARAAGWAVDTDTIFRGVTSVAASIAGRDGRVRACLSASLFAGRETEERVAAIGAEVRDAARHITRAVHGRTA
jgi:IclR family acetate operon transcriptional repressor